MDLKKFPNRFKKTCSIKWHKDDDKVTALYKFTQRRFVSTEVIAFIQKEDIARDSRDRNDCNSICDVCISRIEKHLPAPSKKCKTEEGSMLEDIEHLHLGDGDEKLEGNPANYFAHLIPQPNKFLQLSTEAVQLVTRSFVSGTLNPQQQKTLLGGFCHKIQSELDKLPSRTLLDRKDEIFLESYQTILSKKPDSTLKDFLTMFSQNEYGKPDYMMLETTKTSFIHFNILLLFLFRTLDNSTCRKIVKTMELFQWIHDPKFISNTSLSEAMLLLNFSHSQYAVDLLGKLMPSGSSRNIRRIYGTLGDGKNQLPRNDVIIGMRTIISHSLKIANTHANKCIKAHLVNSF